MTTMPDDEKEFKKSFSSTYFGQDGVSESCLNSARYRSNIFANKDDCSAELKRIRYSIMSADDIINGAVCEVSTAILYHRGIPQMNGLLDARMGTSDPGLRCITCSGDSTTCRGHHGFIRLPMPVLHTSMLGVVLRILRCVCVGCLRLRVEPDDPGLVRILLDRLSPYWTPRIQLTAVSKYLKGRRKCQRCDTPCPGFNTHGLGMAWTWIPKDLIALATERALCEEKKINWTAPHGIQVPPLGTENLVKVKHLLENEFVETILRAIPAEDYLLIGINVAISHPANSVMRVLYVPPPVTRPSVCYSQSTSHRSENDITLRLQEVLRSCGRLRKAMFGENAANPNKRKTVGIRQATSVARAERLQHTQEFKIQTAFEELGVTIAVLMHAESASARKAVVVGDQQPTTAPTVAGAGVAAPTTTVEPKMSQMVKSTTNGARRAAALNVNQASYLGQLSGKAGLPRHTLAGKRADYTGRAVVSCNTRLSACEVGFPTMFSRVLTKHTRLQEYNAEVMRKRVIVGPEELLGAISVKFPDGEIVDLRLLDDPARRTLASSLAFGVAIEHPLPEDSLVLMNRQPTLHRPSIMAHRVKHQTSDKICHSVQFNLAVAPCYNVDIDGDEMNCHVPQTLEAEAEMMVLMAVEKHLFCGKNHRPQMGLLQDTVAGAFRMTRPHAAVSREEFMQATAQMTNMVPYEGWTMPAPQHEDGVSYTGMQLFSVLLPPDFCFEQKVRKVRGGFDMIVIQDGQLISGQLCKKSLGTAPSGLILSIGRAYGPKRAIRFLDDAQLVIGYYVSQHALSLGIDDILISQEAQQKVDAMVQQALDKADEIARAGTEAGVDPEEIDRTIMSRLQEVVNRAGALALKAAPSSKNWDNGFVDIVSSGAKGSIINLAQTMGCVGQQTVDGKRISGAEENSHSARTMPCYPLNSKVQSALARGFIPGSFLHGLSPGEMFAHLQSSRDALISVIRTALVGYAMRKLTKATEGYVVRYDGTVRESYGNVISFEYGGDGMDGACLDSAPIPQKREDLPEGDKETLELFEVCTEDVRRAFRSDGTLSQQIYSPIVGNRRLVQHAAEDKLKGVVPEQDRPKVFLRAKELLDELCGDIKKHRSGKNNHLLQLHLRTYLSPATVVDTLANVDSVERFFAKMNHLYFSSLVEAGEAVGPLAAEAVGQPLTQTTLNVFHLAGITNFEMTVGVPRMVEIIDASKNPKTPSMTIFLKEGTTKVEAEIFALKLVQRTLADVVGEARVVLQPDMFSSTGMTHEDGTSLTSAELLLREERLVIGATALLRAPLSQIYLEPSKYVLLLVLDRRILFSLGLTSHDIARKIETAMGKGSSLYYMEVSSLGMSYSFVRLRICGANRLQDECIENLVASHPEWTTPKLESIKTEFQHVFAHSLRRHIFHIVKLGGVKGITDAAAVEDIVKRGEYIVRTQGINTLSVWRLPNVRWMETFGNDIHEIYDLLGIEAVVMLLYHEMRMVLSHDGSLVADRHVQLMANAMTRSGTISPLTRHGLNKLSTTSALVKSSFEEQISVFVDAAVYGEDSEIKDVADSVMCGKRIPTGTGMISLVMDPAYKKLSEEVANQRKENTAAVEEVGGNQMIIQTPLFRKNEPIQFTDAMRLQHHAASVATTCTKYQPQKYMPTRKLNQPFNTLLLSSVSRNDVVSHRDAVRMVSPNLNISSVIGTEELNRYKNFKLTEPIITINKTATPNEQADLSSILDFLRNFGEALAGNPTKDDGIKSLSRPLYSHDGKLDKDMFNTFLDIVM